MQRARVAICLTGWVGESQSVARLAFAPPSRPANAREKYSPKGHIEYKFHVIHTGRVFNEYIEYNFLAVYVLHIGRVYNE